MLEVQVKISPAVIIKADGTTHKEVFEKVAELQEVFGEKECGHCKGNELTFRVREVDGNKYYELKCLAYKCGATLSFGQNKTGGKLFPIRKIMEDGENKGRPSSKKGVWDTKHQGWYKWTGKAVNGEVE